LTEHPTPASGHDPSAHAPATPSTGTLFYLFGDRVAPAAGRLGGTVVPYVGTKVKSDDLAGTVLAATIWGLRQAGLLKLEEVTTKSLGMFKQQHIALAMVGTPSLRTGYDDLVLRGVGGGARNAYDVVYTWYGSDVADPAGRLLGVAEQEMVQLGLADAVDAGRGAIAGKLLGNTKVEPNRQRIGTMWAAFEQAHAGWQMFQQSEPTMATTLLTSCRKAIKNRQDTD
jgi:hypothetical protein